MADWYYLDEDCNAKVPDGLHCECCKKKLKATQSFESFKTIIKHPTEYPTIFRMAKPLEKGYLLIGSHCLGRVINEFGVVYQD